MASARYDVPSKVCEPVEPSRCASLTMVTSQQIRWVLVNPEGAARPVSLSPAARPVGLEGKTIGLAWNGKPGGDEALDEIAALLAERVAGIRFVRYWRALPASIAQRELTEDVIQSMADYRPDVVIVAQAD